MIPDIPHAMRLLNGRVGISVDGNIRLNIKSKGKSEVEIEVRVSTGRNTCTRNLCPIGSSEYQARCR